VATILLIDDSRLSRSMAAKPLAEAGYAVVEAVDGEGGLRAVEQHQPDCVVTDLLMPGLDGFHMLEEIRRRGNNVPVIVLTADIQEGSRAECERQSVVAFLNKPIDPVVLREAVDRALLCTPGSPPCR